MNIIDNLNDEQILPVQNTEGAVLVTAGAGSGKTRLLTHRIAYLIFEKHVPAYNILAITFTNKAANEMKQRVEKMVGEGNNVFISTFHSLCVRILRRDIEKLGYTKNFSIYSDTEKKHVLKEIYKQFDIENDSVQKSIEYHISNAKNQNANALKYVNNNPFMSCETDFMKVFEAYEAALKKNNALDFDDLLTKTLLLFRQNPDVLEFYQDRFRYIHVDEFQDTNKVQYDIVSLLSRKWGNVMVVGDEDQCIYGWRGANIENIMNFKRDFPLAKVYKLEQNYRSTKAILKVANSVIKFNKQRLAKILWTANEQGVDVVLHNASTDWKEAEYIVKTIVNCIRENGYKYSDFAILLRLNAISNRIEECLKTAYIPYKFLGGLKSEDRSEIKVILAYLRAVANPFDNESFLRIINFPKRGIGDTTVSKMLEIAGDKPLIDVILNIASYSEFNGGTKQKIEDFAHLYQKLVARRNDRIDDFVKFLIDEAKLRECYNSSSEEDVNRKMNVDIFIDNVCKYACDNPSGLLEDFLQTRTLKADADNIVDSENVVLLSTIHAVKGLEYPIVFIAGLEEGIFPIIRQEREEDIEEERRLMYVAVTRAQKKLFLTYSSNRFIYNDAKSYPQSRFIEEMGIRVEDRQNMKADILQSPYIGNINAVATQHKQTAQSNMAPMWKSKIEGQKKDVSAFVAGTKVLHPSFGVGIITDDSKLSTRMVTVAFEIVGSKTLSLDYAPLQILKNK